MDNFPLVGFLCTILSNFLDIYFVNGSFEIETNKQLINKMNNIVKLSQTESNCKIVIYNQVK